MPMMSINRHDINMMKKETCTFNLDQNTTPRRVYFFRVSLALDKAVVETIL